MAAARPGRCPLEPQAGRPQRRRFHRRPSTVDSSAPPPRHKPSSGKQKLRPLPERAQVQIGREIATGVAYLHSEQLIHRDIKAANVLLDEHLHVKLADFGISTGFGPEHTAETGTYRYMAPEVT